MSAISFRQSFRILRIPRGVFEGRRLGLERDYLAADCFDRDE